VKPLAAWVNSESGRQLPPSEFNLSSTAGHQGHPLVSHQLVSTSLSATRRRPCGGARCRGDSSSRGPGPTGGGSALAGRCLRLDASAGHGVTFRVGSEGHWERRAVAFGTDSKYTAEQVYRLHVPQRMVIQHTACDSEGPPHTPAPARAPRGFSS
jgi:hypothetical protein